MIHIKNISFKYNNSKNLILNDFNLSVNEGEVIAVVGPSGGGKSTLLRIIAGFEEPFSGEIKINGDVVFDKVTNTKPEKRKIGMVFQDYALFPHLSVRKNIEYGLTNMTKSERRKRVEEVLELVKLNGYEDRFPHELSGGQQQRVALARTLASSPRILLLDEPFSNLDYHLLKKVRDDLFKIIDDIGITTIMVTHNLEDAKTSANRIIYVEDIVDNNTVL